MSCLSVLRLGRAVELDSVVRILEEGLDMIVILENKNQVVLQSSQGKVTVSEGRKNGVTINVNALGQKGAIQNSLKNAGIRFVDVPTKA